MKKVLGIGLFLVALYLLQIVLNPGARTFSNHLNLAERIGLYGLVGLGAGILIISGGIDLSIGSTAVFSGTLLAVLLDGGMSPFLGILLALGAGVLIGLFHGLVVTKLRVQAFVVTLCGLFIYRGLARWLAGDRSQYLPKTPEVKDWQYWLYESRDLFGIPMFFVILLALAALATVFLHFSVHGRYLSAIGNNEKAARYSGIRTDRYKILAYIICSTLAAFYGVLSMMKYPQIQPSGDMAYLELYAIAAAVLGGCSLRGGEGTIPGILIGTCILRLLYNLVNMMEELKSQIEPVVVGVAILLGAIMDEVLRRERRVRPPLSDSEQQEVPTDPPPESRP